MRFGIIALPANAATLADTAMLSERLGFDSLYAADHLFAFVALAYPFLDGWATLGGWAQLTTKTRLGVFVANLAWRDPVLMARSIIALDQFSRGRFALGVGSGRFADQVMKGALDMTGEERIARLDEGLVVLDRLLRNDLEPFSGRFTTYAQAQTEPGCLQSPRPPLIVAAHGPRALKVAALRADVWSSYGDLSRIDLDGLIALTKSRNDALNAACTEIGRDRATIGRSLIVPNSAVDPWGDPGPLTRLVEELRALRSMRLCSIGRDRTATTTSSRTALDVLAPLR